MQAMASRPEGARWVEQTQPRKEYQIRDEKAAVNRMGRLLKGCLPVGLVGVVGIIAVILVVAGIGPFRDKDKSGEETLFGKETPSASPSPSESASPSDTPSTPG